MRVYAGIGALSAVLAAAVALAHHSVPVNFDQSRQITVEGVLTEIKWLNPHSHFLLDVTDETGGTVEWLVEMGSFNEMRRANFETAVFTVGTRVSITGWPGWRDRTIFYNEAWIEEGAERRCIPAPPGQIRSSCGPGE